MRLAFTIVGAVVSTATICPPVALTQSRQEKVIVLDVPGTILRDVLTKVFDGRDISVEWLDKDAAEQVVKGHYEGSIHDIAAGVLSRTDFAISYDGAGGIRRIVVKGRNLSRTVTPSLPSAQPLRVELKRPQVPVQLTVEQRRHQVREKILKKMQSTNEAVRQRMASLPPGWRPLRTQAIMTVPAPHRGSIPLIPPRR